MGDRNINCKILQQQGNSALYSRWYSYLVILIRQARPWRLDCIWLQRVPRDWEVQGLGFLNLFDVFCILCRYLESILRMQTNREKVGVAEVKLTMISVRGIICLVAPGNYAHFAGSLWRIFYRDPSDPSLTCAKCLEHRWICLPLGFTRHGWGFVQRDVWQWYRSHVGMPADAKKIEQLEQSWSASARLCLRWFLRASAIIYSSICINLHNVRIQTNIIYHNILLYPTVGISCTHTCTQRQLFS